MTLKTLQNAISRKEIMVILGDVERKPGPLMAKEVNEESKKKGFRLFLLIMATLCISAVTYFAYIGGGYIAQYAGPIALIFGILDLSIVILLFTDAVKGKLRLFVLLFEIASLAYLGYAMGGYFGGGNLRTAAEKKLSADYAVAKEHYTVAEATAELMQKSIDNAAAVAEVESQRDGKGVVFEKASFIASMKPSVFPLIDSLPSVPTFNDLTAGNKWLQSQRQIVADRISKYDASVNAMRNQAKGTNASLEDALKMALSQQQISNLQVLAASMEEIANKESVGTKISDEILTPSDLKADGFQSYIGYIIDVVIIFFILMLALQKNSEKGIEEIKDQEMKSFIEEILSEEGIAYDTEMLKDVPATRLYEALKIIFASDGLLKYLKTKVSFHEYVEFLKEYPQLARALGTTLWSFAEIKKEIQKNPSFVTDFNYALQVSPSDWKMLVAITPNPEQLFEMDEETRNKFLFVLKQIQAKAKFKEGELKNFMAQFILEQNPTDDFMKSLEICASTLASPVKLKYLTGQFINTVTPYVAKFLCQTGDNEKQFGKIVSGWTSQYDDAMAAILADGIVEEATFERFMKCIIDWGGIDGMKKLFKTYSEKKKQLDSTSIGNKVLTLKPDFSAIKKALVEENDEQFLQELENALCVENTKTSF